MFRVVQNMIHANKLQFIYLKTLIKIKKNLTQIIYLKTF